MPPYVVFPDATLIALAKERPGDWDELLDIPGGTLRGGAPADVILFDADLPWVLDRSTLKSRCSNSPFDEARLSGRVLRTIVAGRTVYEYV